MTSSRETSEVYSMANKAMRGTEADDTVVISPLLYDAKHCSHHDDETNEELKPEGLVEDTDLHGNTVVKKCSPWCPDQEDGDAWRMLAAVTMVHTLLGYSWIAFTVYYISFEESLGVSKSTAGWIGSVHTSVIQFCGLFVSSPITRFGCRPVAVLGTVIAAVGFATGSLAYNVLTLCLTYGIIAGIGLSMLRLCATVLVQEHFSRNRAIATGISVCGYSIGNILGPLLANWTLQHFGWRGALLLQSGFMLQALPLALTFRTPPKPKPRTHRNPELELKINHDEVEEKEQLSKHRNDVIQHNDVIKTKHRNDVSKTTKILAARGPRRYHKMLLMWIRDTFDFSLLKNTKFTLFCLGTFVTVFNEYSFFHHIASYAVHDGASPSDAALLVMVLSISTTLSLVLCSAIANLSFANRKLQYAIGATLEGVSSVLLALLPNYAGHLTVVILFGASYGCYFAMMPVVCVELLGVEKISRSKALCDVFSGIAALLATPVSGLIFDMTRNYDIPFLLLGSLQIIVGFPILALVAFHKKSRCCLPQDPERAR